jgi:hypothetical protein
MTATNRPVVKLDQPGEVIASIPALLGFHPADSLVALGMSGPRAKELGVVLRTELPPASRARELAFTLLVALVQQPIAGVTLVVVGGGRPDDDLPHRELLARCESVFVDNDIPVIHQLWTPDTTGGRKWYCYDETDCGGVVGDPATTELAAIISAAGLPVFDRREDIVATLAPEPPDVLARRSASLDRSSTDAEPSGGSDPPTARLDAVRSAIEAAVTKPPVLTDQDVASLAGALADHRIRDVCLDFEELLDVAAAERLWTALAKATPPPESAEAACLLAFSAYARGDGVLAGIALEQALAADPGHRLSGLLRSALTVGLPPDKIRIAGIRAATFARQALTREDPPS